ncbi:Hypothetical predicted protein [Podarcis lilfordi]|uniref:Uncharacterized protein n=1 Tax=Podarcis lilfordi TaxID=74358 RepID=A0AA35L850_9SAUR|nr:Hypothetical predicted protein [Podarcis lilfordi]
MTDGREEGSGEVKGRARARPPATRHTRALLSVSSLFPPDSKQRLAPLQGGLADTSDATLKVRKVSMNIVYMGGSSHRRAKRG